MKKKLFLMIIVLVVVVSCDNRKHEKGRMEMKAPADSVVVKPEVQQENLSGFNLIPSKNPPAQPGNFDKVWGELKTLKEVFIPSFIHQSLPEDPSPLEEGLRIGDLPEKSLYVQTTFRGQTKSFNVLYTDVKLFTGTVMHRQLAPEEYLKEILYDHNSEGVAFNPRSRVMERDLGFTSYLFKTGMAELIGYLQSDSIAAAEKSSTQLAKEAAKKGEHYKVLYYWAIAHRAPKALDDWTKIELDKLKAYWELNFPGSRKRALGELNWFAGEHGKTPEIEALLAEWQK